LKLYGTTATEVIAEGRGAQALLKKLIDQKEKLGKTQFSLFFYIFVLQAKKV